MNPTFKIFGKKRMNKPPTRITTKHRLVPAYALYYRIGPPSMVFLFPTLVQCLGVVLHRNYSLTSYLHIYVYNKILSLNITQLIVVHGSNLKRA